MAYVAFITLLVFSNVKFLALRILSTYSFLKKSLNYCLFKNFNSLCLHWVLISCPFHYLLRWMLSLLSFNFLKYASKKLTPACSHSFIPQNTLISAVTSFSTQGLFRGTESTQIPTYLANFLLYSFLSCTVVREHVLCHFNSGTLLYLTLWPCLWSIFINVLFEKTMYS